MTLAELKEYICKLVGQGIGDGEILWTDQYTGKPEPPLTTLKMKDAGIALFPVNMVVDGEQRSYYEATKILEINRYTMGNPVYAAGSNQIGSNQIAGQENTAVDEITRLLLFLQSEEVADSNIEKNVSLVQMGSVRDLTALGRGLMYDYRAMQEFTVLFVLEYRLGAAPEVKT